MAMQHYIPPAIIQQVEESRPIYTKPYFYEYDGAILNLSAATRFYIDYIPLTNFYWACAKISGNSHHLAPSMSTKEEAMQFLRELTKKIEENSATKN
jgi:hypothetical protein